MNIETLLATIILTYVVFEGFKEFFLVAFNLHTLNKEKYRKYKEKRYVEYIFFTRLLPIFKSLIQPKVFYPILFFIIHEEFIKKISSGGIEDIEMIINNSGNYGIILASIYGLLKLSKK